MLIFHILIAISSIVVATSAFQSPSVFKLRSSYLFAFFTLLSGSYLIFKNPAHLVQACIVGIAYFVAVSVLIFVARRKFDLLGKISQ